MVELLVNDAPSNRCFGCSPHNEHGMQLAFEKMGPGSVETRVEVEPHFCGPDGVIHGGIQAVLLDEALGLAIQAGLDERATIVTAEFQLRYRRPAPVGKTVVVRGRLVRSEGRDFFVEGEIATPDGQVVTRAEARWCRLD